MTPKLLLAFSDVVIIVYFPENHFDLLRASLQVCKIRSALIFQILRSQPWPNLRHFSFRLFGGTYPMNRCTTELTSIFHEYKLIMKNDRLNVKMPQHFSATISCNIFFNSLFASLYCGIGYK